MNNRVDPLLEMVAKTASISDEHLVDPSIDAQRDRVFSQIVSTPLDRADDRIRRGPLVRNANAVLAGAAVVLVAIILIALQSLGSAREAKAAGVHFVEHDGYIDATIDDPSAPAASMEAAFAERGLDITVNVIPASPGLVGTITFMDNASFEPIYGPEGSCLLPGGGTRCIVGLRVPADFKGSWEIEVNGTTAPGQQYVSTQDALAPGEELHCSGVRGMTVAQANPILEDLGVTVVWPEGVSQSSMSDQFIGGTDPVSPGTVRLHVQQRPLSKNEPSDSYYDALNRGC